MKRQSLDSFSTKDSNLFYYPITFGSEKRNFGVSSNQKNGFKNTMHEDDKITIKNSDKKNSPKKEFQYAPSILDMQKIRFDDTLDLTQ